MAAFEGMTAAAHFFPPEQVATVVPPLLNYLSDRSTSVTTLYGLWVEDEDVEERTSGRMDKTMRVFIEVATRYSPAQADPFLQVAAGIDPEEKIRSKQISDVHQIIASNSTIGGGTQFAGLYENWEMIGSDTFQVMPVRVPGWVTTNFETLVTYFHSLLDATVQGP